MEIVNFRTGSFESAFNALYLSVCIGYINILTLQLHAESLCVCQYILGEDQGYNESWL